MNDGTPRDDRIGDAAERLLPAMRAYVRRSMGSDLAAREMSVDIVQSVFRELAGQRGFEFESDASMHRWLRTAAAHKILERARYHRAQQRDVQMEQRADRSLSELTSLADRLTPSRAATAREELARVEDAIGRLSDRHREVLVLTRISGKSHDEVAEHFGITVEASRALLHRALTRLASLLQPAPSDDA